MSTFEIYIKKKIVAQKTCNIKTHILFYIHFGKKKEQNKGLAKMLIKPLDVHPFLSKVWKKNETK